MSDLDRDGCLDFPEFVIITHILFTCRRGIPLPQQLPPSLVPPSKANLVNAVPTPAPMPIEAEAEAEAESSSSEEDDLSPIQKKKKLVKQVIKKQRKINHKETKQNESDDEKEMSTEESDDRRL